MPPFGPIKRKDLLHYLKELGYEGPYVGGKYQYLVKGQVKLYVPNPHQGEIRRDLLTRILKQAGINREDWEKL